MDKKIILIGLFASLLIPSAGVQAESLCGGIQGLLCPDGYTCMMDANTPDAMGTCVKPTNQAEPRAQMNKPFKNERREAVQEFKGERKDLRDEIKDARQTLKGDLKENRMEMKGDIKNLRNASGTTSSTMREFMAKERAEFQAKREEFLKEFQEKRKEFEKKAQEAKDALKAKLSKVKDERKKEIVERVGNSVNELNKKRTDQLAKAMDQLDSVLARIGTKVTEDSAKGLDVTAVNTAIATAQTKIAAARTAIAAQAGKVYTLTLTGTTPSSTESNLKKDSEKVRDAFKADVKTVEQAAKDARSAVHDAAVTLGKLHGGRTNQSTSTASSSAN